jgi:flagellum-specific ATP synthase
MSIETAVKLISQIPIITIFGVVRSVHGLMIKVSANSNLISVGTQCQITLNDQKKLGAEVVGFEDGQALIMPYGTMDGIRPGAQVVFLDNQGEVFPSESWLGRVINGIGQPIDEEGMLAPGHLSVPLRQAPPSAHARQKVSKRIDVGIKAVNTFLTVCKGQRMGIFAGSGVGKSKLLSMLARYTDCDVCVIGLIGERGREVREFIEDTLGEEGLKKSVLVVATSDESPLMRRRAAYLTMSVAEYFRDQGKSVLCLMDSVTRLAMAQREIGLSSMEPPTTKGYTPSVFVELAKVMERAGPGVGAGMITAFFTVLVDGDDHNEPIADASRGILDGHIVLERAIAERGHYPAINILKSISRMVPGCHLEEEQELIRRARYLLSTYEDMADMIRLGAYRSGSNAEVDEAIAYYPQLQAFLSQHHSEKVSLDQSFELLREVLTQDEEVH